MVYDAKILDGWFNAMSGVGLKSFDRRAHNKFSFDLLDEQTLSDVYRGDGLGTNVIDIPIGDMVNKWFYIENDTDNIVTSALDEISAKKYVKEGLTWGDLFGGGLVFMGIEDGQQPDQPVKEALIQRIAFFEVYDKRDISWQPEDLYTDKREPNYGKPRIYRLADQVTGMPFPVHESRVLIFDGKALPRRERQLNKGWGDSRLHSVYERLKNFGDSIGAAELITSEFIVAVLKVTNLSALLSSEEGTNNLRNRVQMMDLVKSVLNTIVIDKNEELERISSFGVAGLRDLLDLFLDIICGEARIPRIKFIGDQTKGLGSEATGNLSFYYDDIKARQEFDLLPQLKKLCRYTALAKKTNYSGDVNKLKIVFNELWQQSEKEKAETLLINSKSDGEYIDRGLPAEFVILSRFGGQSYGKNITLSKDFIAALKKMKITKIDEEVPDAANSKEDDTKASSSK